MTDLAFITGAKVKKKVAKVWTPVPAREFTMPMEWASNELLFDLRAELTDEIRDNDVKKELIRLAAKRNGLTAVLHEMKLRGINEAS